MRLSVWLIEFIKLVGRRRLHPLNRDVRLPLLVRWIKQGRRRHMFAHRARTRGLIRRVSLLRALYCEDEAPSDSGC